MAVTVPYTEMYGSGAYTSDANGGSAVRRLKCDWSQSDQLIFELRGAAFTLPAQHPVCTWLYCSSASREGHGPCRTIGDAIQYPYAIITVNYSPLDGTGNGGQPGEPGTYMREDRDISCRFNTPEDGAIKWASGADNGKVVPFPVTTVEPITNYSINIFKWWNAPVSNGTFENATGKINDGTFRALWTTWPDKTLMFYGARFTRDFTDLGPAAFNVTLMFGYNRQKWDKKLHKSGEYETVKRANGDDLYEKISFSTLVPF